MNHLRTFEGYAPDDEDNDESFRRSALKKIEGYASSFTNPLLSFKHEDVELTDVTVEEVLDYVRKLVNPIQAILVKPTYREANPADEVPKLLQPLYIKGKALKDPTFYIKSNTGTVYCTQTWDEIIDRYRTRITQGIPYGRMAKWLEDYDVYGGKKPSAKRGLKVNGRFDHPSELTPALVDYGKRQNIITSDATDVVRLCRIIDTEDEPRYDDEEMTFYRAVVGFNNIRPGDWVTTDRSYAEGHNDRYLKGRGNIVEVEVNGLDVLQSPTGNWEEAIYAPRELSKPYDFYQKTRKR